MKITKSPYLKIFVSLVLFSIILWRIDREALFESFRMLDVRFIPVILLLLILKYVVSAFRWKALLIYENSEKVSVSYLTNLYFIGSFFNNFMPTSIGGDVFKVYKLGKKLQSTANAFSATFMERFTGVIALVLISSVALVYLLKFWGVLLFLGFWVGLVVGFYVLKFLSNKFAPFKKIYSSLIKYKGQNRVLWIAFLTSFLAQFLAIGEQYVVFAALGHPLPVFYALFMFPLIVLASFFIPSINGVGVQDALYILFFGQMTYIAFFGGTGVGAAAALSASITYHLARLTVSLIGGVLYGMGKAE
jgi:glycosyltransferase 2 family protein